MESGFFSNSTAFSFIPNRGGSLAEVHDHCAIDLWLEQGELEIPTLN